MVLLLGTMKTSSLLPLLVLLVVVSSLVAVRPSSAQCESVSTEYGYYSKYCSDLACADDSDCLNIGASRCADASCVDGLCIFETSVENRRCDYQRSDDPCEQPWCVISPGGNGSFIFHTKNGSVYRVFHADPSLEPQLIASNWADLTSKFLPSLSEFSLTTVTETGEGKLAYGFTGRSYDIANWQRSNYAFDCTNPLSKCWNFTGIFHGGLNVEGVAAVAIPLRDPMRAQKSCLLLFGGKINTTVVANISIVNWVDNWRAMRVLTLPTPSPRFWSAGAQALFPTENADAVVFFGGFDASSNPLDDVWYVTGLEDPINSTYTREYEKALTGWSNLRWARVEPNNGSPTAPARAGHFTAWRSEGSTGTLFVGLGVVGNGSFVNDVWKLSGIPFGNGTVTAGSWTQCIASPQTPSSRAFTSWTTHSDSVIVYGGRMMNGTKITLLDDVWLFSLRSERWLQVSFSTYDLFAGIEVKGPTVRQHGVLLAATMSYRPFPDYELSAWLLFGRSIVDPPANLINLENDLWRLDLTRLDAFHSWNGAIPSPNVTGKWFPVFDQGSSNAGGPSKGKPRGRSFAVGAMVQLGLFSTDAHLMIIGSEYSEPDYIDPSYGSVVVQQSISESRLWEFQLDDESSGVLLLNNTGRVLPFNVSGYRRPQLLLYSTAIKFDFAAIAQGDLAMGGGQRFSDTNTYIYYSDVTNPIPRSQAVLDLALLSLPSQCASGMNNITGVSIASQSWAGLVSASGLMTLTTSRGNVCFQSLNSANRWQALLNVTLSSAVTVQPSAPVQPPPIDIEYFQLTRSIFFWRSLQNTSTLMQGRFDRRVSTGFVSSSAPVQLNLNSSRIVSSTEPGFIWSKYGSGCISYFPKCYDSANCTIDICNRDSFPASCEFKANDTACFIDDRVERICDVTSPQAGPDGCLTVVEEDETPSPALAIALGVVLPLIAVLVVIGVIVLRYRLNRQKQKHALEMDVVIFGRVPELSDVEIGECIGKGAFGAVFRGRWLGASVACKSLTSAEAVEEADQEAKVFLGLNHPNIVNLLGVHRSSLPSGDVPVPFLVFEFCDLGSFEHFAPKMAGKRFQLFEFLHNLVAAVLYIHSKRVVHNDIACRNLLITSGPILKLSDFGHAVKLGQSDWAELNKKIAIRWSSPEAITTKTVSFCSDIWQVSICGFELFGLGELPFKGLSLERCREVVCSGQAANFVAPPSSCPEPLVDLLTDCLALEGKNRPSAKVLLRSLNRLRGELFPAGDANESVASTSTTNDHYQPPLNPDYQNALVGNGNPDYQVVVVTNGNPDYQNVSASDYQDSAALEPAAGPSTSSSATAAWSRAKPNMEDFLPYSDYQ